MGYPLRWLFTPSSFLVITLSEQNGELAAAGWVSWHATYLLQLCYLPTTRLRCNGDDELSQLLVSLSLGPAWLLDIVVEPRKLELRQPQTMSWEKRENRRVSGILQCRLAWHHVSAMAQAGVCAGTYSVALAVHDSDEKLLLVIMHSVACFLHKREVGLRL